MKDFKSIEAKLDGFIESQRQVNDAIMAALGNITPEVNHLCTVVESLVRQQKEKQVRSEEEESIAATAELIRTKGLRGKAAADYLLQLSRERIARNRRKKA